MIARRLVGTPNSSVHFVRSGVRSGVAVYYTTTQIRIRIVTMTAVCFSCE